ncbi:MAG: GGDEF domain-containing protein [Acidobacteriota bacterium]
MIDSRMLELAGIVSQATTALTLGLLAWSDRRSRGMIWLAAACGLDLMGSSLRPLWLLPGDRASYAAGDCLLVLQFFFVYMGLRWFVLRRRKIALAGPLAVSLAMVLVLAVNPFSTGLALAVARMAAIAIMGRTVMMLVQTRFRALRQAAWGSAGLMSGLMVLMALRVPLDVIGVGRYVELAHVLRAGTLVGMTLLALSFIALFVAETQRRLHDETRKDPLTGLRNRRAMEEIATQELQVARRTGSPLMLLMMDIDHFKKLNDTWGHALGDRALRAIGGVLLTVTGADERVTRMGGEEFAVLLPGCDIEGACRFAERLRATVEGLRLTEKGEVASCTVSIGIGEWEQGDEGWADMLRRADEALYRAKREGRNRVVVGAVETDEELATRRGVVVAREGGLRLRA